MTEEGGACLADLAWMRNAVNRLGQDKPMINPLVPVDLVIDHTVIFDYFGPKDAAQKNTQLGNERNRERYEFFKAIPKIALGSPPADYKMTLGIVMCADQIDVVSRMLSMGKVHGAYPTTGAIGTAGAARIEAAECKQVRCTVYRTARRIMDGYVYIRS